MGLPQGAVRLKPSCIGCARLTYLLAVLAHILSSEKKITFRGDGDFIIIIVYLLVILFINLDLLLNHHILFNIFVSLSIFPGLSLYIIYDNNLFTV